MAEYKVFDQAQIREDEIWDYTVQKWGVEQAVKYITGLHNHFSSLANRSLRWKKLTQPDAWDFSWLEYHKSPECRKYYPEGRGYLKNVGDTTRAHQPPDLGNDSEPGGKECSLPNRQRRKTKADIAIPMKRYVRTLDIPRSSRREEAQFNRCIRLSLVTSAATMS
ncbi:MAG: hypothetical protein ACI9OD_000834 [Limisphaerales bacterium]|jgi:hypothetical protein